MAAGGVLITGASGLLGQWVTRQWPSALRRTLLDRSQFDLLSVGAAQEAVRQLKPEVVLHLAWCSNSSPTYRVSDDNDRWVDATLTLAEACESAGAHLLAVGSAIDRTTEPSDAYTAAKAKLRRQLAAPIAAGQVTWLRPYYVVDPQAGRPTIVALAQAASQRGEILSLRTPWAKHDFVHAADVGSAIVTAVGAQPGGEVSIGSGRLRTVAQLVDRVGTQWQARPGSEVLDHSAAKADIGWLTGRGWAPAHTEEFFGDD